MADYYPLIARAVSGLDSNTGETRRTLYERARAALVAQLRSVEPTLEESEITRERLALEEAIRKVEAESVRRTREEPPHAPSSLSDDALRGFRDTVGGVDASAGAAGWAGGHDTDRYPPEPSAHDRDDAYSPPYEDELPSADYEPRSDAYRRSLDPVEISDLDRVTAPAGPAPLDDLGDELDGSRRSSGGLVRLLAVLLIVGGLAGAAYWQRAQLTEWWTALRGMTEPATPAPTQEAAPGKPKIADRIAPAGTPSQPAAKPAAPPATEAAQKVVLYEEVPGDPTGKRSVGSALWRTETVSPGSGLAAELAVRADVEIPERRIRMTLSMRRNTDKALPASHTIEIMFTLPADFPEGSISNVPGVLMKTDEQGRGAPLAGLAVKVTSGFFLIGLSAVEVDVQRNLQMLKERAWMDIPIVYNNGERAILAIEKGPAGEKAFEDAFAAWSK